MTQNRTKRISKKQQTHMICISSNNDRHPVPKTFTPLHYNCRTAVSGQPDGACPIALG